MTGDDAVTTDPARCPRRSSAAPRHADLVAAADDSVIPFTTTGTTPAGSLDEIRFLGVGYSAGSCPSGYNLVLYREGDAGYIFPVVTIKMPYPFMEPSPGTVAAHAWLESDYYGTCTDEVRFEVVHLDPLQDGPMRIAGRVVANDGAWNLDFTLDATTMASNCI